MQDEPLLAHLAGRFVSQRENLATVALAYILSRSEVARSAMVRALRILGADLPDKLTFRTQAAALDQAIPDLVGEDLARIQHLIVEAKFWAGLTAAQPVTYLQRIASQGCGSLVFIVPSQRAEVLWQEIIRRCREADVRIKDELSPGPGRRFASLQRVDCGLGLITWKDLLGNILSEVESAGEQVIASDVRQLQGLCDREDAEAFLPLSSEEMTGGGFPKRILQFCDLVDDLTSRLVNLGIADVKGLRATVGKGRYGRYLRIHNVGCSLSFNAGLWGVKSQTPIWLRVVGPTWAPDPAVISHVLQLSHMTRPDAFQSAEGIEIPVHLLIGQEREQVFEHAIEQLKSYAEWLNLLMLPSPAAAGVVPPLPQGDDGLAQDEPLSGAEDRSAYPPESRDTMS